MAETDHAEVLQNLMAITGADDAAAVRLLEATNWALEDAVNLHFATADDGGATLARMEGGVGASASATGPPAGPDAAAAAGGMDDDAVRAPIPTKMERLYADHRTYSLAPSARSGALRGDAGDPSRPGVDHVDPFRDFKQEGERKKGGTAGAGASGSGAGPSAGAGLSGLFQAPTRLQFRGTFEEAKAEAAAGAGRWLLVNVQSATEFSTHRLNRDTWRHGLVEEMVGGSFVFFQVYDSSQEGQHLTGMYHLTAAPATLIVDPVTGGKMWERLGFIEPDALIEELVPFLDTAPHDPAAARLAQASAVRRPARAGNVGGASAGSPVPMGVSAEDAELAAVIALSMEGSGGGAAKRQRDAAASGADGRGDDRGAAAGGGVTPDSLDDADEEEAAVYAEIERMRAAAEAQAAQAAEAAAAAAALARDAAASAAAAARAAAQPAAAAAAADAAAAGVAAEAAAAAVVNAEAVAAAAAARLPPEPTPSDPDGVRVALRLPSGERPQRRFPQHAPLSAVFDFALSVCKEAAAGRAFGLAQTFPGAAALHPGEGVSVHSAGVANSILNLSWK